MDSEEEEESLIVTASDYCIPTYGVAYLSQSQSKKPPSLMDNHLYKTVEFYKSNGKDNNNGNSSEDSSSCSCSDPVPCSNNNDSSSCSTSRQLKPEKIEVKVHKRSLWKTFMKIGNEMIVTKPGR